MFFSRPNPLPRRGSSSARPRRHSASRPPRCRPLLEELEDRWVPSSFLVPTAADSGPGSLRQAILDSNAAGAAAGPNAINFNLPQDASGYETISPASPLPAVTAAVMVDGTTQP